MSEVTYMVDAATLAAGACPSTYQELADLLASIYSVTVNTNNTGIVVSATKPADTTIVWKQLNASTLRPMRDYVFVGGLWLSRHTMEPGEIIMYRRSVANIWSFDGGDGTDPTVNPPGPISGAMWKVCTELQAKFPIGVGTLPSSAPLALGDTGGLENVTLTLAQLPTDHQDWRREVSGAGDISGADVLAGDFGTGPQSGTVVTGPNGGGLPHTNMPPYYALNFLERTDREYFVVP